MSPRDRRIRAWIIDILPWLVAVNLILFIGVGAVATVAAVNALKLARLESVDRDAALGSCVRLKIQRTQVNRIALLAYRAFSDAAARERRLAAQPGPLRAAHRKSATQTQAAASNLRWTPQTDCAQAVADPKDYAPPRPVPFIAGQRSVP